MSTHATSGKECIALDSRTTRALTEYMTVLGDVGRVRDAEDLYLVVSQSGKEYLVDTREGTCECPDSEHRGPEHGCKHVRRARLATGDVTLPASVVVDLEADSQLGAHVAGPRVVATDGGRMKWDETPGYSEHVEPASQGGERYVKCRGCGRELLVSMGGREKLPHVEGCPNTK